MEAGDAPRSDAERLKLVRHSTQGANQHRLSHRHKHGRDAAHCFVVAVVEERSVRPCSGPSCTCTLEVLVCGISIQPILKHEPRSLTCVRVGRF